MLVRKADEKLARLDRRLRARELREVLPAVLLSAMFGASFVTSTTLFAKLGSAAIILSCGWIVYYLLRYGRGPASPSPAVSLDEYRAGAAAKFDHQIRLLSNVKYWYVLPLYFGMVVFRVGNIQKHDWVARPSDWWVLGGATVVCAFIVWLNEVKAVGRLREERDRITAMLDSE